MASGVHEISKTDGCQSQLTICTRDQLWVANTYGPPEVRAVLCSVALSHEGGENGASSSITERSSLLISGCFWNRWWGKRSRHSWRMHNLQFYVSGKRPIGWVARACCKMSLNSLILHWSIVAFVYMVVWLIDDYHSWSLTTIFPKWKYLKFD